MITNKIIQAEPLANHCVKVAFRDGKTGIFDVTPYLDKGVFRLLQKPEVFGAVRVEYGTLVWPNEIDIAPDTVEAELQAIR